MWTRVCARRQGNLALLVIVASMDFTCPLGAQEGAPHPSSEAHGLPPASRPCGLGTDSPTGAGPPYLSVSPQLHTFQANDLFKAHGTC